MPLHSKPIVLFGTPMTDPAIAASTTNSQKPTIILVHSAWLGQWQWEGVIKHLDQEDFNVLSPDLPGHGADTTPPGDITMDDYVNALIAILDQQQAPVLLLGHSFNGITISRVAELRPDKIAGLIYLCAFFLPPGASFFSAVKDVTDSLAVEHFYLDESQNAAYVEEHVMHEAFAHDIPKTAFDAAKAYIVPEPAQPLSYALEITEDKFGKIEKYYIECTQDKALPIAVQRNMYVGNVKKAFSLDSAHTPNFSQPDALASVISTIANEVF